MERIHNALFVGNKMTRTYQKQQPETIQKMFGSIAKQYDRTNAIQSFYLHLYWNAELVKSVSQNSQCRRYLDLCCGTGEIAYTFLKRSKHPTEAFLLDFCQEMLDLAKSKKNSKNVSSHQIQFIQGDAQAIPLPSESIDTVTIAYGIRNVQDPQKCISDVYRVLRPGGKFAILELTQPSHPVLKLGHKIYLRTLLPIIGKFTAANQQAYEYLSNSILEFIPSETLEGMLEHAGFTETKRRHLTGGIATIVSGSKPQSIP